MMDWGYYNMDCMDGMKQFPDKYFDIAVVDPPYGINVNNSMGRRKNNKKSNYPIAYWDDRPPGKEYFDELFRVSQKIIIWGGNYFDLPPAKCFFDLEKIGSNRENELCNGRVCMDKFRGHSERMDIFLQ